MKKEVIAQRDPKSPVSEMFRTLRTNLQFMNTDDELKTILITSTLPGEGKSWVASNLAVTFAQTGKNVILIDADMRKGRLYTIFEVSPRPGLSNYLSGVLNNEINKRTDDVTDFIQKTEIDNLSVISAGNVPPNPSELLVSHKMTRLINQLKEKYDIIIFDGTPSLLVTDAIILSRLVDMTLLVTAHKETKVDNIDKVKRTIENVGGKVAGVVVNKIPMSGKKYEDTYYYGSREKAKKQKHKKKKNDIQQKAIEEIAKAGIAGEAVKNAGKTVIDGAENKAVEKIAESIPNIIDKKDIITNNKSDSNKEESPISKKKENISSIPEDVSVKNNAEKTIDIESKEKDINVEKEIKDKNELVETKNGLPIEKKEEPKSIIQSSNIKQETHNSKPEIKPKSIRRRKNAMVDTTVRRTIKSVNQDINEINSIIEETMSKPKKKRKHKDPDRSKDILNQINKYLDKD